MDESLQQSIWLSDRNLSNPVGQALGQLLTERAKRYEQREAVVYACHTEVDNVRWSFRELDEMSTAIASALLQQGYAPGDRVALWAANCPEWILLEYALAKAGLVIVALNPLYKSAELAFALATARVKGIFHADEIGGQSLAQIIDEVRSSLPTLQFIHPISRDITRLLKRASAHQPLPTVDPDSCLMIQYTSGTTGEPKAAQLSHAGIATMARNSYQAWGFGEGDRVCHGFPLYHVGGSGNSTPGAALIGATTLPLYIFKARRTLDILEQERCSGFIGVPSMLTAMLEDDSFSGRDLSALKYIVAGGACVPAGLIRQCEDAFGVDIINGYGQTETSGVSCSTVAGDSPDIKSTTSGKPLPGVSLKVIDKSGAITAIDQPGELCYRGPGNMLGYLNHPNPEAVVDSDGWVHSGDLAEMNTTGFIRIVGRVKEMIIRGGENLSPSEIEAFLCQHPDVVEAAVIGLPDSKYGEEVCAVLVGSHDQTASPEQIRRWCADKLSRWKVPRYISYIDALPKTSSGKIQKFKLKQAMIAKFNLEDHVTA
ncbi:class I adenylate-forming enzyme family protein [Spongiibacter marinus]|uniref:class I adenylate-forming enzyme family protein n=1 Tax=Spongiibacter marinus TaxID=354246 RepID=UPI00196074EC|nr:AMP-binding protein [Spongiibacter marinus]MBM7422961.1 fatty-acyl-CoA synthase [Spongiibacter marinus]